MNTLVTTYDHTDAILAKYQFSTWEEAGDFVAHYDLETGNMRDYEVVKVTIEMI